MVKPKLQKWSRHPPSDLAGELPGHHVEPGHAPGGLDGGMAGLPVLVGAGGAVEEEVFQQEVADPAGLLRRTDAGLLHGEADALDEGTIDRRGVEAAEARGLAAADRAHDARLGVAGGLALGVSHEHMVGGISGEVGLHLRVGEKDEGLDVGRWEFLEGLLAAEQTLQPLALAVGEDDRVFDGFSAAVVVPGPVLGVAPEVSRVALDLGQEYPLRASDQQCRPR